MSTLHLGTNADPTKNITITPDGTGNLVVRDGNGAALATIEPGDFTAGTNRLSEKLDTDQKIVTGTPVTLTNQTFVDFAIPSWAKRITVMFDGVSTSGASPIQIQLGDAGGVENSGYLGAVRFSGNATSFTSGFLMDQVGGATYVRNGCYELKLLSSDVWVGAGLNGLSNQAEVFYSAGSKTLSDTLTTVRITTVNGTDQFDAGTINVMWE